MTTAQTAHLSMPVGERDHMQGPAGAPVTLVEYGDFQCPYCGRADPIVKALPQRLGDRLRFVFRNFPLTQVRPHAQHAAEVAEAAQGKFWKCTTSCSSTRRLSMTSTLTPTPGPWASISRRSGAMWGATRLRRGCGKTSGAACAAA